MLEHLIKQSLIKKYSQTSLYGQQRDRQNCLHAGCSLGIGEFSFYYAEIFFTQMWALPACRRLLFPLLHAEKGRLRNAVVNRVPASCWVPKILGTRCDRLTHSAHCLT